MRSGGFWSARAATRVRIGRLLSTCLAATVLIACTSSNPGPEQPLTYRVVDGACGDVVFTQNLGVDSASVLNALQVRKRSQYGNDVTIQPFRISVVDQTGTTPAPRFYALRVLDGSISVHSVIEVITTSGDLFTLRWCPD